MDNKAGEVDPWASVGNMAGNKSGETVSAEGLAREAKWNNAMADAPEFAGNKQSTPEVPERDKNISDASAILKYGLNAAAREVGVETVVQTINNFVPNGQEDPIKQLYNNLGIDTRAEYQDLADEARASKPRETDYISSSVNAPASMKRSPEDALDAIKEVKELVAEVQSSPAYANLRAEAVRAGKGIFEYAVHKYGVRDLTVLFNELSNEKNEYNQSVRATQTETNVEPQKDSDDDSENALML